MMASMNISMPEALKEYVEEQVRDGAYGTTSEYLRELIRADKKRKAQERLESLLIEGVESENSEPVTPQFWDDLWGRVDARLQQRVKGDS